MKRRISQFTISLFAVLLLAVPLAGLIASLGAVRSVVRAPLLETLRSE